MEKIKNILSKFGTEIFYILFFIMFLGCSAIGLYKIELNENEYLLSVYFLLTGGTIESVVFKPDFIIIFIVALVLISLILVVISKVFELKNKKTKNLNSINFGLLVLSFVLFILSSIISANYSYISENNISLEFNDAGFITIMIALGGMLVTLLRNVFNDVKYTTKDIVEISILVSLAIVLDKFASFDIGATGGSFNLSGIPLLIICLRHGALKGLISSSVVFGLLTCLLDGYGLQTYPFDYLIAFSGYALCGLSYKLLNKFSEKGLKQETVSIVISFLFGALGVLITRMVGSTISSVVYWNYDLVTALSYNILYVGPSATICFAVCAALTYPILKINHLFPVVRKKETE